MCMLFAPGDSPRSPARPLEDRNVVRVLPALERVLRRAPASVIGRGALLGAALIACRPHGSEGGADSVSHFGVGPAIVSGPTVSEPDPIVPLTRTLSVCTDVPTTAIATVDDGIAPFRVPGAGSATCHELPILGLKPDRQWCTSVALDDGEVEVEVEGPCFDTDPLPALFPAMEVFALDEARIEPGVRILALRHAPGGTYVVGLDEHLDVVWLHTNLSGGDLEYVPSRGTLLSQYATSLREIDFFGRELRRWTGRAAGEGLPEGSVEIPLGSGNFSHDAGMGPDGSVYAIVSAATRVPDYPASYLDPVPTQDTTVLTEAIEWYDGEDGALLGAWPIADLFDVHRVGFNSLDPGETGYDWGHANALQFADDGSWALVSLRHQDAVALIDVPSGAVRWIVANHDNWNPALSELLLTPVGPLEWQYHQHASKWDPATSTLYVHDNGNGRASPYTGQARLADEETYTRLVAFHVDESARTVSQDWAFTDTASGALFSDAKGDIRPLPATGNVLGLYAAVKVEDGQDMAAIGLGDPAVRLVELAFDPDPVAVMDVEFHSDGAVDSQGWSSFRADFASAPFPRVP